MGMCLIANFPRNIGDIAVKDILPAKVDFVITLLNNSDSIRNDLDHMMYHMGNLITLKQSVIDSVSAYIEQNRNFIQNLIGREFQFDSFFRYFTLYSMTVIFDTINKTWNLNNYRDTLHILNNSHNNRPLFATLKPV